MSTAYGTYATLALATQRLIEAGLTDTSNDPLITSLCNQANLWIETRTHRILAPLASYSTTLAATAAAGATSVSLVAVAGTLQPNETIMFGAVTAKPHESALVNSVTTPTYSAWQGTHAYLVGATVVPTVANGHFYTATAPGTSGSTEPTWPTDGSTVSDGSGALVWQDSGPIISTVTLAVGLVSGYAAATVVKRVYIYDGFDRREGGRILPIGRGIRQIYSLEVTPVSAGVGGTRPQGGAWFLLPRQDYFIRPVPQMGQPSWPATELWITNIPTPGDSTPLFFPGFNNVRIDADLGWPAVPDEIIDIALKLVVAGFRARTTAGTDTMTLNIDGSRRYEYALSWQDKQTLDRYTLDEAEII